VRQVFRLIGSRYGAALVLVVVIAVVVGVGKLLGGPTRTSPGGYQPNPAITVNTSPIPDDGLVEPSESPAGPSASPGTAPVQTVAVKFAQAWLHHAGVSATDWHAALGRYSTKALTERLKDADPTSVPATRTTGDSTIVDQQPSYVIIAIPLDAGTLSLRMVTIDGRWLVDGVDWQRP
jgi:Uncharacterized conserved protein